MEVVGAQTPLRVVGIRKRRRLGKTSLCSRVTYVMWATVCRSAGDQKGLHYVSHNRRLALFEG